MKRKWLFIPLLVISTTLTSGCWNKKELNEIAIVSAVGIDKSDDGKLMGTFQIINPGSVTGTLQGGGGQSPPISILSSKGYNVLELDRHTSAKLSRAMYLSHANLVVISEEQARTEGILPILDAFDRAPPFRTTARMIIARDVMAKDILETLTVIDKVSATKVVKMIESTEKQQGESISVNIQEVIKNLVSQGREPVISGVGITPKKGKGNKMDDTYTSEVKANPVSDGIAIFKKGKLVSWLDGEQAKGALWVLGKIKNTNVNIDWKDEKDAIDYQVVRQKTDVKVKMKKGTPKVMINVQVEGEIRETKVPVDFENLQVLLDIEKALGKDVKEGMKSAIAQAQDNHSDIFGFGDRMHQSYPQEWGKLKEDWHDVTFPKLEVEVKVNTYIRRTGLRNKPFLSNLKHNE